MNPELFFKQRYARSLEHAKHIEDTLPEVSQQIKTAVADLIRASGDAATGAVSRGFFFDRLAEFLRVQYPQLEDEGRFPVGQRLYFVLASDIKTLSLFNSISQEEGDRVLARAAQALLNNFPDRWVGRIGGDEFAALVDDAEQYSVDLAIELAQAEIAAEPPQWIDAGYASHQDVLHYLSIVDKDGSYFAQIPKEKRTATLADILVGIAAFRAQIAKCYKRIGDAIAIRRGQGEDMYQAYMVHARKGAAGISDEHVSMIMDHVGDDLVGLSRICLTYSLIAKREAVTKADRPKLSVNLLAMLDVAETAFYEEQIVLG